MTSVRERTVLEPGAGVSIDLGVGRLIATGTVHARRNAISPPEWPLVLVPVEGAEPIAELGEHPLR